MQHSTSENLLTNLSKRGETPVGATITKNRGGALGVPPKEESTMGVKVRERPKDSGVWWVFIDHKGQRRARKCGSKKLANKVAKVMEANLTLGRPLLEEKELRGPEERARPTERHGRVRPDARAHSARATTWRHIGLSPTQQ